MNGRGWFPFYSEQTDGVNGGDCKRRLSFSASGSLSDNFDL